MLNISGQQENRRGSSNSDFYSSGEDSETRERNLYYAARKFGQNIVVQWPNTTKEKPIEKLKKKKRKSETNRSLLPPEDLTIKRPSTDDFLDFLCFRGTSHLSPRLNHFYHNYSKENTEPSSSNAPKNIGECSKAKTISPKVLQARNSVSENDCTELDVEGVSSRPSRKSKEVATLYISSHLKSSDEEYDKDYIQYLPQNTITIEKEKEGFKEISLTESRQQVEEKQPRLQKSVSETIKMKEKVRSEHDEENEPLSTRIKKKIKEDIIKFKTGIYKKMIKGSSKKVRRSDGERELRILKEIKNTNDEVYIDSDVEEDEIIKTIAKKVQVEKTNQKVSVETVIKPGVQKNNNKIKLAKITNKTSDKTINVNKWKVAEKNKRKADESGDTDTISKLKVVDNRKLLDNEEGQSPEPIMEQESSSLNNEKKTKIAQLSKYGINEVTTKTESEPDKENVSLLKLRHSMQKKGSPQNKKITNSGRSLGSSKPKAGVNINNLKKKREKCLRGIINNNDDKTENELFNTTKYIYPKKLIEEKYNLKERVIKNEMQKFSSESSQKNIKETSKRRRKNTVVKKIIVNEDYEIVKLEKSEIIIEKRLNIINKVNITEIRLKMLSENVTAINNPKNK